MSVILQRGDKIHLCVPVDGSQSRVDMQKEAVETARQLTAQYATYGVHVELWAANTGLTAPVVVAVFREVP